jgi:NADPH2:quinone reductase
MLAIEIREPGGPDVLTPVERPIPAPAAGDVLIKVVAAGVNRPDVAQRQGTYPPPPGASDIPGLEVAGTVEQVGGEVRDWRVGDRVCALVAGGGYAEHCVAPAPQCLPIPRGMSAVDAAAIPETFFTVWTNVFDRGRLAAGESFSFTADPARARVRRVRVRHRRIGREVRRVRTAGGSARDQLSQR